MKTYQSWGRLQTVRPLQVYSPQWLGEIDPPSEGTYLCYGKGRSYGDSCLTSTGSVIDMALLSKIIDFNTETGVLICESGLTIDELLRVSLPKGWFVPVTPGTKYITIGGAIANDVHGKNHHKAGNFGHHILRFDLLRSTGELMICTPTENSDWFSATIGGLGLTGIITKVTIQLKKIYSPIIEAENCKFGSIDEFLSIAKDSENDYEYTVSWIDCTARQSKQGRGIFIRGNHSLVPGPLEMPREKKILFPMNAPDSMLNNVTVKIFNELYFRKQLNDITKHSISYEPFFYPLDSILHWNRMYGKRGFFQYQCLVPMEVGSTAIQMILRKIAASGEGSFLSVLKTFGTLPSLGMMSFPRSGITLALDFGNNGENTLKLLSALDEIVAEAGGAVYPAKDARMSPDSFRHYFPQWQKFVQYIDPRCMSDFWLRVTKQITY